MRRFLGAIVATVVLGSAVWLGQPGSASTSSPPEAIEPPSPATQRASSPTDADAAARAKEYLGVSSCASSACHGGPSSGPLGDKEKWHSSYTVWATRDKHSRAYSVLFDDRSQRIIELLNASSKANPPYQKAQNEQRCLACHAAGQGSGSQQVSHDILADGVGCELCHGPAQNWLKKHTERGWLDSRANKTAVEIYRDMPGMTDTRDLLPRATACVSCHVGSREPGQPIRDVNHDLIAAGHPRLNFEFNAYLDVMPKHWADEPNPKKLNYTIDSKTHAEAWAIGQTVSTTAATNLIAGRAAVAKANAGTAAPKNFAPARGLEFSEFDCYACHHELGDINTYPSVRQAFALKHHSPGRPGALPPNLWYAASPLLSGEPTLPAGAPWTVKNVDDALALAAKTSTIAPKWDSAAQRFLALQALLKARSELRAQPHEPASSDDQEMDRAMEEIRKLLEFQIESGQKSSGDGAKGSAPQTTPWIDSPRNFNPTAVEQAFERLFLVLHKTLPPREGK